MSNYQPVADLKVKTREYTDKETGKLKGVWNTVGTLWSTEHGSSQFITLDSIPVTVFKDGEKIPFDGRVSVFRREEFNNAESDSKFSRKEFEDTDNFNKKQSDDILPNDDEIDLNIPF